MAGQTDTFPLIRTKLQRPRLPGDLVRRARLTEQMQRAHHRKLTLISAMAGTGKTTLLARWLEECPQPSAWLSLDEGDNDRIVFLTYLCGAIRTVFPIAFDKALSLLHAPQTPSARAITTLMVNELDGLFADPSPPDLVAKGARSTVSSQEGGPSPNGLILALDD
jgi:LuxR family maltose regulon positive regulatory protein